MVNATIGLASSAPTFAESGTVPLTSVTPFQWKPTGTTRGGLAGSTALKGCRQSNGRTKRVQPHPLIAKSGAARRLPINPPPRGQSACMRLSLP
jgi:hypothetical protein